MGKFVLLNARIFTSGADLSGNSNKLEISSEIEDQDSTSFGSGGWSEVLGGLASTEISGAGQWEAGDPSKVDDSQWAALGGVGPWSMCPDLATVGQLSYFTAALDTSYKLGGDIGNVAPWEAKASSSWPLVRGQIAHPPGTARTATGTGSGVQLVGGVPVGKQLYAALHVLSVAGTTPSITAAVESDTSNAFAAPTTRATFAAAAAAGGQILRAPGAITDTWFRLKWTISGSSPSFLFVAALGVA